MGDCHVLDVSPLLKPPPASSAPLTPSSTPTSSFLPRLAVRVPSSTLFNDLAGLVRDLDLTMCGPLFAVHVALGTAGEGERASSLSARGVFPHSASSSSFSSSRSSATKRRREEGEEEGGASRHQYTETVSSSHHSPASRTSSMNATTTLPVGGGGGGGSNPVDHSITSSSTRVVEAIRGVHATLTSAALGGLGRVSDVYSYSLGVGPFATGLLLPASVGSSSLRDHANCTSRPLSGGLFEVSSANIAVAGGGFTHWIY